MAFHLGSLGFLTPFKFESYKIEVAKVFEGGVRLAVKRRSRRRHFMLRCDCGSSGNAAITLRSRLKVKVVKDMPQTAELPPPQEHNGLLPHGHTNSEAGKVTLQLQVSFGRGQV